MTPLTSESVRTHLEQRAIDEPTSLNAYDTASDLELSPKAIAQSLHQLQAALPDIALTQWAQPTSGTWRVQRDSP